jgi:peptidoglycan hydrolase-like protein with peptidoglycan-binding domain
MNKTTKNILIGVGVLVGLYFANRLYKRLSKPSAEQLSLLNKDLVLAKGSKGAEVIELQRILKDELGYDLGSTGIDKDGIDGIFGSITEKALFQAKGVNKITLKDFQNDKK